MTLNRDKNQDIHKKMVHLEGSRLDYHDDNPLTIFEESRFAILEEKQNYVRRTTNSEDRI